MKTIIQSTIEVRADTAAAFESVVEDLASSLEEQGLRFETGRAGRIMADSTEVARVAAWKPAERILLSWPREPESTEDSAQVEISFEGAPDGTVVTVEVREWGSLMGEHGDRLGWFATRILAPILSEMSPQKLGDWITDRVARRPTGRQSRDIYRDPLFHYPNFRVILEELAPTSNDYLLEVGCGGGAMLRSVLESGCKAAAVDHSLEMIRVARDVNRDAVKERRLEIVRANANCLPFRNDTFTCAAMTGVLGFLTQPVAALAEIRRTLVPGGRLVLLGSDPELKGTPAAPEPIASRLRFYEDDQLETLGRDAGFRDARVIHRDLESYAREAGVPEELVPLFSGITRFLVARNG